MLLDQAG